MKPSIGLAILGSALLLATAAQAIAVHKTDFIPDGKRTGFNGFESIPHDRSFYSGGAGPYAEDGIQVEQVSGDAGNDILVTIRGEGQHGWYPSGGDRGYTRITLVGGGNFISVGMLVGSGYGTDQGIRMAYQLWDNGYMVASGRMDSQTDFKYLGFGGGGFDTILLRDSVTGLGFGRGSRNALALDAIEISAVPDPSSNALMALGLVAVASVARRRRA